MICFTFSNILIKFTDIIKIEKWEGIRNNSLLRTLNSMKKKKKQQLGQAVVVHTFNPSTWEAEAGNLL